MILVSMLYHIIFEMYNSEELPGYASLAKSKVCDVTVLTIKNIENLLSIYYPLRA